MVADKVMPNIDMFCPCYVEFVLEHSPSVPVRSPPFYPVPSYYSVLLRPFLLHPYPYYVSILSVSFFQLSTLGSGPFSVSSDLAFILLPTSLSYYFCYCLAITPISPTPSHPVFLLFLSFIVLWSVHPYCSDMYKLRQALVV